MTRTEGGARRFRPTLGPTIFTVLALAMLLALGVWQVERLGWKTALIARRTARLTAPILRDPGAVNPATQAYRRLRLRGRFLNDKEMYLAARSLHDNLGFHVVTPLRLADGGAVLVDRGFVPFEAKDPARRPRGQRAGEVTVIGVIRRGGPSSIFTPDNQPKRNIWYTVDTRAMARHAGLSRVVPYFVEADAAANPGGLPIGGQTRTRWPNNHLQYAITWFSLAIALMVIYVIYHWQPEDKDKGTDTDTGTDEGTDQGRPPA